jgi:hypothetical protein
VVLELKLDFSSAIVAAPAHHKQQLDTAVIPARRCNILEALPLRGPNRRKAEMQKDFVGHFSVNGGTESAARLLYEHSARAKQ